MTTLDIQNKNTRIFAIGAFDRFNYGDLLFPIISKNFFNTYYPDIDFDSYALIESDYSEYGALKTKSISQLYKTNGVNANDVIYFCGGGVLGSDWSNMHANLLGNTGNLFIYYINRLVGCKTANNLSRLYFGAKSEFPWIASPDDFSAPVKIMYNAVGGSELAAFPEDIKRLALKKLSTATHLSVRDAETKRVCSSIESSSPVHLTPDSAVLMSEQFPIAILKGRINAELLHLTSQDKYVCFHCNYRYAKKNSDEIVVQLENIYRTYGLKTLLLPIGRYVGLDDQKGLLDLKNRIQTPVDMVSEYANIWEIMYSIASATLFIGTSLHGNVTAQSFAVPHIGLSDKKSKLDFYLEAWDLPEQASCPNIGEVSTHAGVVLAIPEEKRQQKSAELINLATNNLHAIAKNALI